MSPPPQWRRAQTCCAAQGHQHAGCKCKQATHTCPPSPCARCCARCAAFLARFLSRRAASRAALAFSASSSLIRLFAASFALSASCACQNSPHSVSCCTSSPGSCAATGSTHMKGTETSDNTNALCRLVRAVHVPTVPPPCLPHLPLQVGVLPQAQPACKGPKRSEHTSTPSCSMRQHDALWRRARHWCLSEVSLTPPGACQDGGGTNATESQVPMHPLSGRAC